jgi:hypothetical protein
MVVGTFGCKSPGSSGVLGWRLLEEIMDTDFRGSRTNMELSLWLFWLEIRHEVGSSILLFLSRMVLPIFNFK